MIIIVSEEFSYSNHGPKIVCVLILLFFPWKKQVPLRTESAPVGDAGSIQCFLILSGLNYVAFRKPRMILFPPFFLQIFEYFLFRFFFFILMNEKRE